MDREPLALYVFRFVMGLGLFAFMAMLYWSSVVLESDVKALRAEVVQLRSDLFSWSGAIERVRGDLLQALVQGHGILPAAQTAIGSSPVNDNHLLASVGDDRYPNLLQADAFYQTILPKLLGSQFKPHGVLRTSTIFKPENLHPFDGNLDVMLWNQMCRGAVGRNKFGFYNSLAPDLALKMEERKDATTDLPEYWIFLRRDVYWQPLEKRLFEGDVELAPQFLRKHLVTAHDFKLFYDAVMNPHMEEAGAVALRNYMRDIESVRVIDDYTFAVRWKTQPVTQPDGTTMNLLRHNAQQLTAALQPLPSFVYQYFADGTKILEDDDAEDSYRTSSVWAQNFTQHWSKNTIISCGPWIFDGMTDQQIRLRRNPEYYNPLAVLVEASDTLFRSSSDALWQDFQALKTDSYTLNPEKLAEWEAFKKSPIYTQQQEKGLGIDRLDYVDRSYAYIAWNQNKPYFKSKKVRQALTMSIDRQRLIAQNLNGMGIPITGTFYRYSKANDSSIEPWPYDPQEARRLLEEEEWFDSSGNGIRSRTIDGKAVPFAFKMVYYVKSTLGKTLVESVATMLREVGIVCEPQGLDVADLTRAFEDKTFDALTMVWSLGTPPEDPRQLWHSEGAFEKGSSNSIGFANAAADKIIDQLNYISDPEQRITLYHQFDAILHDEQPYTFLFSPKRILLYRRYLQNVFIPAKRQDLVPGADVSEPQSDIYWLKKQV